MRSLIKLIVILLCLTVSSGCRDIGRESAPNERSFVSAVGIDLYGDEWLLTVEVNEGGEEKGRAQSSKGETLPSAMSGINASSRGDLLFTHCRAIILGNGVEKERLETAITYCKDELRLPLAARLISTENAAELLLSEQGDRGYEISDIADNVANKLGFGAHSALYEIETARLSQNAIFAVPYFLADENIRAEGLAVFKDGERAAHLSNNESVAYAVLRNVFEGGEVSCLGKSERISSASSKLQAGITDNILEIKITVCVSPKSEMLTALVRETLKKRNTDIFGIGDRIKRQDPSLYGKIEKDFENYYKNAKISVEEE